MTYFAIGILVTIRCLLTRDYRIENERVGGMSMLFFSQVALESFVNSFLSLLMPYLLQCQLRDKIRIRPGENLLNWLYGILFLQVTGLLGRIYMGDRWWAVKRAGDALGVLPVITTAKLHFRIVKGQVKVLHQTLMAMEYAYFVCSWFAVVSYGVFGPDDHSFPFRGFRVAGFFLPRIRLFYHGFLLNVNEEVSYTPPTDDPPSTSTRTGSVSVVDDEGDVDNNMQLQLVGKPL